MPLTTTLAPWPVSGASPTRMCRSSMANPSFTSSLHSCLCRCILAQWLCRDVDKSLSNATTTLLPWYLNYLNGTWPEATQCMGAGDNGWTDNHAALNGDLNTKWALNNTPCMPPALKLACDHS